MHFHLATHILDAPRLDEASNEEVVQFVDKYVSCCLPDEETQNDLYKLVTELNTHKHTKTCKKHGSECRFSFPRPLSPATLIARPQQIDENDRMTVAHAKDIMKKVYNSMSDWNYLKPMTLDGVLKASGVSQELYIDALKVSTKRKNIILKRDVSECNINNYNPIIMSTWRANMDIQYILDPYACVAYVTSYLCKAEKTMSELLSKASKEAHLKPVRDKFSLLGNVFLTHREISTDEAIYRILSMPLRQSSRQIIFLPTDQPNERTRLLKKMEIISQMANDEEDVYATGIINRLSARPNSLEDMCYADFGALLTTPTIETPSEDTNIMEEEVQCEEKS